MAKLAPLSHIPDAYGIIVVRIILLLLSIAGLAVYGATISIYRTSIASTGVITPPHNSPLAVNKTTLIPLAISILWSITQFALLARRLFQAPRRNSRDGRDSYVRGKPVVHPGWAALADGFCWVLFLVMAILSGTEASRWKSGRVEYGSTGTRQVNLGACPTSDAMTGMLDYWCEPAWNQVVSLSKSGTTVLSTLALAEVLIFFVLYNSGIHFSRVLAACYRWYLLRRYPTEAPHRKISVDDDVRQTNDIELEQK